jgi:hypothetical protein
MAVIDDLRQSVSGAISSGASAARAQGVALKGDFESLVKPQLDDILVRVAAITENYTAGNILEDQAQSDLAAQRNRVVPIILGVAELTLLALQTIINAVMNALKTAVNTAAGIALL